MVTSDGRPPVAPLYDLVVVGAGIAGLNALYAATHYLSRNARVLLIDQKHAPGGMWNETYDYVRLHQPHPMFTVGDLKWTWKQPRNYLAKHDEVRDHLASSLDAIAAAVNLETRFQHTAVDCAEVATDQGFLARVTLHPNGREQQAVTVEAKRALHAPGLNVRGVKPLKLSSDKVVSIAPQELRQALAGNPAAPVYVVGGGKTGMDTILATLAEDPGRRVILINGRGTNFLNRTKYFPAGLRRWVSGALVSRTFRELALIFNGDNEEELIAHFRRHHATDPATPNRMFLYGMLSEDEHARITRGLSRTYADYLVDVRTTSGGPVMDLRGGLSEPVEPHSIFVNCTGTWFRVQGACLRLPCVSPHGAVASVNTRDGFHFLSSVAAFFVTHLLYREALRGRGFYTLDHEALYHKNRTAWTAASAVQAYMNQVIAVQTLPATLLDRCGLDYDRWYPWPRRMAGLMRMKATARRDVMHCRSALDRIADRFGVNCAALK